MTHSEHILELMNKGYIMTKEYHPWGYAPVFKNYKTGDIIILDTGIEYNPVEYMAYIKDVWMPTAQEDIMFCENGMDDYFTGANKY